MSWRINYNPEKNIIELNYFDMVSPEELQQAFEATYKLSFEKKVYTILADCRELKGGHTLFDLLKIIEEVKEVDILSLFKEAVILPPEQIPASNVEFWETACRNRGIKVKIFEDTGKAEEWLFS